MDNNFTYKIENISKDLYKNMVDTGIYNSNCPVDYQRLSLITLSYVDFDSKVCHDGQIMVLDIVAEYVTTIFQELFSKRFPINKIQLLNHYNGNDELAMADNNSSGFNYRKIIGTSDLSIHSYGTAIDINPVQNPYIILDQHTGCCQFYPPASIQYANRAENRPNKAKRPGMVEEIVDIFLYNGFLVWGGYWDDPIDYHHFQIDRIISEFLAKIDAEDGHQFFTIYVNYYRQHQSNLADKIKKFLFAEKLELITLYNRDKNMFFNIIKQLAN